MNLLTEREYYKPFNYPWAYEHYKTQQHMHWLPDEVNLADDLRDYRDKLTPENRRLINQIFRFFTQADVDVCCGYAKHYLPTFKQPEVRMMLSAFAAMEAVHQEAYSLLLETLGFGDDEYQKFFEHKAMMDKHEHLSNFGMDSPMNIAKTMAIYSGFTEGVQLFSSFAILLNFPRTRRCFYLPLFGRCVSARSNSERSKRVYSIYCRSSTFRFGNEENLWK